MTENVLFLGNMPIFYGCQELGRIKQFLYKRLLKLLNHTFTQAGCPFTQQSNLQFIKETKQ